MNRRPRSGAVSVGRRDRYGECHVSCSNGQGEGFGVRVATRRFQQRVHLEWTPSVCGFPYQLPEIPLGHRSCHDWLERP